jgi:hypothetical protein
MGGSGRETGERQTGIPVCGRESAATARVKSHQAVDDKVAALPLNFGCGRVSAGCGFIKHPIVPTT